MEGKTIAITGGASGIGLSTAILLAKRGAKISIADVSKENLGKAASAIKEASSHSNEVVACQCDVRDYGQVQSWLKQTMDTFGRVDGAANMAGVYGKSSGSGRTIESMDFDDWDFIIGVNLKVCSTASSDSGSKI